MHKLLKGQRLCTNFWADKNSQDVFQHMELLSFFPVLRCQQTREHAHVSNHSLYTLPNTALSALLKAVHDKPQPFLYERNLCRQKWEHQGCC